MMCHQQRSTRLDQKKRFHLYPLTQEIGVGEL
jgi:hypothetical protein